MKPFIANAAHVHIFNVVKSMPIGMCYGDSTHVSMHLGNVHVVYLNYERLPPLSFFRGKTAASVLLNDISHQEFEEKHPEHAVTLSNCLTSLQGNFVSIREPEHV